MTRAELGKLLYAMGAAFIVVCMLFDLAAVAQTTALPPVAPTGGVDFAPLAMQVIAAATMIATIGAGIVSRYLISFLASKVNMQDSAAEKLAADRVSDILLRSIDYAEAWSKQQVSDPNSPIRHVRIDNFFVAKAVEYSISAMPDLIKQFGLTRERIESMILSRLNTMAPVPKVNSGSIATFSELGKPDALKGAAMVAAVERSQGNIQDAKDAMGSPEAPTTRTE